MDKVQDVHDYSEGLYERIQSTLCLTEDDMDVHVPSLDKNSLIAISRILENIHFTNLYISSPPEYFPTEFIRLTINAIQYKVTTI